MYLSRLILNPRSRQVQRDLTNPYQLHKTVLRGFAQALPDDERVLFRLDEERRYGRLLLLVQSVHRPDWSRLQPDYLLPPVPFDPVGNPAVKAFDPTVKRGQMLYFRLQANPTKRLGKSAGEKAGKRMGIFGAEDQLDWLRRKGEQGGFRVLSALPTQDQIQADTIRREVKDATETHKLALFTVRFDGVLQVVDPDQFGAALRAGVGSGKAFGCGLLSVAPAQ